MHVNLNIANSIDGAYPTTYVLYKLPEAVLNLIMDDNVANGDEFVNALEAPAFSIGPGVATNTVIDFTTSTGIKMFASATVLLYRDKANKFDVNAEGIHSFVGISDCIASDVGVDCSAAKLLMMACVQSEV
jgi:hypothetical protein